MVGSYYVIRCHAICPSYQANENHMKVKEVNIGDKHQYLWPRPWHARIKHRERLLIDEFLQNISQLDGFDLTISLNPELYFWHTLYICR